MRRFLLVFFLASPLLLKAQSPTQKQETDSVNYYQREIDQLWVNTYDSLARSHEYDSLTRAINRLRKRSNNYRALVVYGDIVHTNLNDFNSTLVQNGFTPMNDISYRVGFGWSSKSNKTILDFYVLTAGINSTAPKDSETIKLSLSNFVQFDLGYTLLDSKTVSIYPYAGLSIRTSSLKFLHTETDSSFAGVTDIVLTHRSVYAVSTRVGFQAGIGFDFTIANSKDGLSKTILFTKIGMNRPIDSDNYSIAGADYNPGIKQGDWIMTVGIKFASRR